MRLEAAWKIASTFIFTADVVSRQVVSKPQEAPVLVIAVEPAIDEESLYPRNLFSPDAEQRLRWRQTCGDHWLKQNPLFLPSVQDVFRKVV